MKENYFNLIQRQNGYFYYYVYDKFGRRIYRSTGEKRKTKAMEIAIERARTGELLEPQISQHIKFSEYAKDFWNYDTCPIVQDVTLRGGHYGRQHCKNYALSLERVLMPSFGRYYLEELTTAQIQTWLIKLPKARNISNKTCNDYLLNLRKILGQAVLEGRLHENVAEKVKPLAKDSTPHGVFTTEQIKKLFAQPWDNLACYAACLLSAKTGMRMGEIRALTLEQIHEDECYLDVNASWAEAGEGRKTTKSGHNRIVPVEYEMIELLKKVAPMKKGLIFTTNGDVPCDHHYFSDALFEKMKELGISRTDASGCKISFHSFRYFFNSRLVIANMEGDKIRATVGHESSDMTQHYTRLTASDMEDIRQIQRLIG